ncbi:DUF4132 domain-containing protein [Sphingomicrobium arenosum]|uniref:DUF4132 domain-containing protein n=1 Tax=Sphingomicrobium arenosum TaxID=2233861 RepID=UPI002240E941|nr:DUF4132 domain-containing protein [Sphingomicrobium arenosum]
MFRKIFGLGPRAERVETPAPGRPVFGRKVGGDAAPRSRAERVSANPTPRPLRVPAPHSKLMDGVIAEFERDSGGSERMHVRRNEVSRMLLDGTDPLDVYEELVLGTTQLFGKQRDHYVQNGVLQVVYNVKKEAVPAFSRWAPDASRVARMLVALLPVYAQIPLQASRYDEVLDFLVRRAATLGEPALRGNLILFFDAIVQAKDNGQVANRKKVDEYLPLLGMVEEDVPTLAKWKAQRPQFKAEREALVAFGGDIIGPAIGDLFTGIHLSQKRDATPAVQALYDASPAVHGEALDKLLSISWNGRTYDPKKHLAMRDGFGAHELYEPMVATPPFATLILQLAMLKHELADADDVHARLLGLMKAVLPRTRETNRNLLKKFLKTVAAHPQGRTRKALEALIECPQYAAWKGDLVKTLRDASQNAETIVQAELPPLAMPEIDIFEFNAAQTLERLFGDYFDVRLHRGDHRDFLAAGAEVHQLIEAGDRPAAKEKLKQMARRGWIKGARSTNWLVPDFGVYVTETFKTIASFHEQFSRVAPIAALGGEIPMRLQGLAAQIANKSAPTKAWMKEAKAMVALAPKDAWVAAIAAMLDGETPHRTLYGDNQFGSLRTLLYVASLLPADDMGPVLTDYALKRCYVSKRFVGMANEKLGNACVWALAEMDGGIPYLARILSRTKYPKIRKMVDKKLDAAATKAGMSRADLDEATVPTHGLAEDGTRTDELPGGEAVLALEGRKVVIRWVGEAGKQLKSPSTAMKEDKAAIKEVRADAKEIEKDLAAQAHRLQRLYLDDRSWTSAQWTEAYRDHPLMRPMVKHLVWWVEADGQRTAAMPDGDGGALRDAAGEPVALPDEATIRLWHPIDAEVAEVEAWRDRLEEGEITQAFAQVWREVYALTDAERTTRTYSNRWAAHILRQGQAMTLANLNGWTTTRRMGFDMPNDDPWHLHLPAHNLNAEYWVEGAGGRDDIQASESGAYLYLSTDRVVFHRVAEDATDSAAGPPSLDEVPLEDVPPVIFSEVMRTCDLMTSVTSIAADPAWLDRGADVAHPTQWGNVAETYWRRVNEGELSEGAKRRRAMLERLIPKLRFAKKLELTDRTLKVTGTRHVYDIHLTSGAASRSGRHICIVPKTEAGSRLWLPFEGDRTLSIIISKAQLLVNDDKITDPVILGQI